MLKQMTLKIMILLMGIVSCDVLWSAPVYTDQQAPIVVQSDYPVFSIRLRSNPTTGYQWRIVEYNRRLLILAAHHFMQTTRTNQLIGAPGEEQWTFQVTPAAFKKSQETTIRLTYARPWEKGGNHMDATFHIQIRPMVKPAVK
jgi:inhibitor of cysteine peptidase